MATTPSDVVFAQDDGGRRSTSAAGRATVTAALRQVDPAGALSAERETTWRTGYLPHLRRLTVAGLTDRAAAEQIARDGIVALHDQMRVGGGDHDLPLEHLLTAPAEGTPDHETRTITGTSPAETQLIVPHGDLMLSGEALSAQIDRWVTDGIVEQTFADAIQTVIDHPEWLALPGRTVVVLGAGAEMGPLPALLRWGASVAAIDLPRPDIWERLITLAEGSAGSLLIPTTDPDKPTASAGMDLMTQVPAAADWIAGLSGQLVIANMAYADGSTFVRLAVAADAATERVRAARTDTALSFLATPTDAFAVPGHDVQRATTAYQNRTRTAKLLARPLRTISGGRLLRRAYTPGVEPGICDALVPQQGPNYALAKRLQRWRATVARAEGATVSMHVAPATRTRSVTKNRALAAAYAGAHRFGIQIFDPDTTNTLMAALLVHDLHTEHPRLDQVWQDEAHAAAHGGLWTCAYAPRSALGLAALLGLGGARS